MANRLEKKGEKRFRNLSAGGNGGRIPALSSVTPGKEVNYSVYVRGVADVALLQLEVDILFNSFYLNGECLASGEVVDDGACRRKIDRG